MTLKQHYFSHACFSKVLFLLIKSGYVESLKHEIVRSIDNSNSSDLLEIVTISFLLPLIIITIAISYALIQKLEIRRNPKK
jgi:hypothetical protein